MIESTINDCTNPYNIPINSRRNRVPRNVPIDAVKMRKPQGGIFGKSKRSQERSQESLKASEPTNYQSQLLKLKSERLLKRPEQNQ